MKKVVLFFVVFVLLASLSYGERDAYTDGKQTGNYLALASLAVFGSIYAYWHFGSTHNRLRKKLRRLGPLLNEESTEAIKKNYLGVHNLYLKLSERRKQNFDSKITKLRERIEEQLKAEKAVERLLQEESKGSLKEQKKRYLEIYKNYQKLPAEVQEKHYQHLVHLRESLERGK